MVFAPAWRQSEAAKFSPAAGPTAGKSSPPEPARGPLHNSPACGAAETSARFLALRQGTKARYAFSDIGNGGYAGGLRQGGNRAGWLHSDQEDHRGSRGAQSRQTPVEGGCSGAASPLWGTGQRLCSDRARRYAHPALRRSVGGSCYWVESRAREDRPQG